jgi:hypothetical protein
LDEYRDRENGSFDVMGYMLEDGETRCGKVGFYDGETREVSWYTP